MKNLPNPNLEEFLQARKAVIGDFKKTIYGGNWEDELEEEITVNPKYQFISGILYPQITDISSSSDHENESIEIEVEEEEIENDTGLGYQPEADDDEDNSESSNIIDLSTQNNPSAFGLNFLLATDDRLKILYGFSKYKKENDTWKRNKTIDEIEVDIALGSQLLEINESLSISVKVFRKRDKIICSISMFNKSKNEEDIYYQVGMKIENLDSGFLPIKNPFQSGYGENAETLDLLFRNKRSYAIGKGCASDWEENHNSNDCKIISSSFVPTFETKSIQALDSDNLSMSKFADLNDEDTSGRYQPLEDLIQNYSNWLDDQENKKNTLDDAFVQIAEKNLSNARECLSRMKVGLNMIKKNDEADKCFRLMNHAMLLQMNRLNKLEKKDKDEELIIKKDQDQNFELELEFIESLKNLKHTGLKGSWRPFQIAFILTILPEIVEPEEYSELREQVDLIWFPTGGGKTEAYLGLIAFNILLRRLRNPNNAGVTSLMRYTLRLLTSDQFRRSSALICALEFIRRHGILNLNLGDKMISLGLWIGSKGNPNTHANAIRILNGQDRSGKDDQGNYKFVLHQCPWCKSKISHPDDRGYVRRQGKAIIKCSDKKCIFYEELPVFLWEESIFQEKPTLLLGTVDNFAKLCWRKEAIELIKNDQYDPPEMIIQDELHLISGPLGTMVGLFENVVMKLMSTENQIPKIVGASATLTFSGDQAKSLYRGRRSNIFPPQVIDWEDSFFATERDTKDVPGRIYMGYFGSSKGSMIESSVSAAIPLLQSPNDILPMTKSKVKKGVDHLYVSPLSSLKEDSSFTFYDGKEVAKYDISYIEKADELGFKLGLKEKFNHNLAEGDTIYPLPTSKEMSFDPFGTAVWYFNSKRELAYMSNQKQNLNASLRRNAKNFNRGKFGSVDDKLTRFSRQIKKIRELTGRRSQDEIESILEEINIPWTQTFRSAEDTVKGIDILLATNMISVGVDIPRLGLMLVHGQPKTTAEYIQASSRVGRRNPGLVVTIFNHAKSKDRSIYEMFKNYHQSIYRYVETVSVTPFSSGARKRGLPAIFASLVLSFGKDINNPTYSEKEDKERFKLAEDWILDSVKKSDPEELDMVKNELKRIKDRWKKSGNIDEWGKMGGRPSDTRLFDPGFPVGEGAVFSAPTSMRNSDLQVEIVKNEQTQDAIQ